MILKKHKDYFKTNTDLKSIKIIFKEEIGQLLYIAVMTRPDIAYAVNYLAQICETPHPETFDMMRRIRLFLYKTNNKSLRYQKFEDQDVLSFYILIMHKILTQEGL